MSGGGRVWCSTTGNRLLLELESETLCPNSRGKSSRLLAHEILLMTRGMHNMARDAAGAADLNEVVRLSHPVYLDTPMLVSFLASLEDGVSYSSEVASKYSASRGREGEGSGKASLPSIATLLGLNLSAEGRYKRTSADEEGVESKFVREHTAASLFNRLHLRLDNSPGSITKITSPEALSEVTSGSLVELRGEITGNPLKQVLDFMAAIGPYFGIDIDHSESEAPRSQQRSVRPAKGKNRQTVPQVASMSGEQAPDLSIPDMLKVIKREVERSPVLDLLMQSPDGIKAVLTVSRDLLSSEAEAYIIGGQFSVLAKVSAVLDEGSSISLLRRTVFGFGGRELSEQMFADFDKAMAEPGGVNLSLASAVIDGPAIQLLPLAIYL